MAAWFRRGAAKASPAWTIQFAAALLVIISIFGWKRGLSNSLSKLSTAFGLNDTAAVDAARAFAADRRTMREWLLHHEPAAPLSPEGSRGIVMPAGSSKHYANAFVNLYVLRHHLKSTLPVTITYYGRGDCDPDPAILGFFGAHLTDVTFLNLFSLPYPAHHRDLAADCDHHGGRDVGFKIKVFALYAAPYSSVLLLDSDSMPLMDPAAMFDAHAYRKHGGMFWPDRWCIPVQLFGMLGMDDGAGERPQADSGQLFFDRTRHADVLEWLLFLNSHEDFTYRYAYGDKDLYKVAFALAGKPEEYYQVQQPLSAALTEGPLGMPQARGFIQHHPNGSLLFVHRTSLAKYSARNDKGRAFSAILLQPGCHWSEIHWRVFSPEIAMLKRHVVQAENCNFTLYDPATAKRDCGMPGASTRPMILEVPPGAYVQRAQAAADEAHIMFWTSMQMGSGAQKWPPEAGIFLVIFAFVGAAALLHRCRHLLFANWPLRGDGGSKAAAWQVGPGGADAVQLGVPTRSAGAFARSIHTSAASVSNICNGDE